MEQVRKVFPAILAALLLSGCQGGPSPANTIRLATTTSVQDTGLLDVLTGSFQEDGKYKLQAIAVGSGQAMQLGRTGEADILWVHSPDDEAKFVAEGYGKDRTTFLHKSVVNIRAIIVPKPGEFPPSTRHKFAKNRLIPL